MFHRFARALKIANRDSGFAQIFGAALLLVIVGTLTYSINQGWSIVDAFYFAIATLTTSSIADPHLTLDGSGIKTFTVFYILIGIGILVELARQGRVCIRRGASRGPSGKAGQEERETGRRFGVKRLAEREGGVPGAF
jgi:hypothetical protein